MTPATLASQLGPTPRSISAIADAVGCSRREIEQAVEEARRAGFPLVAGQRGVWVATSVDELVDYEARLRSRVRSQMAGVRGVRRAIVAWRGQLRLWDAA